VDRLQTKLRDGQSSKTRLDLVEHSQMNASAVEWQEPGASIETECWPVSSNHGQDQPGRMRPRELKSVRQHNPAETTTSRLRRKA